MAELHMVPVLVGTLVVLVISLVTWSFIQGYRRETGAAMLGANDVLLLGLLFLAAFTMGVFVTYALLVFERG